MTQWHSFWTRYKTFPSSDENKLKTNVVCCLQTICDSSYLMKQRFIFISETISSCSFIWLWFFMTKFYTQFIWRQFLIAFFTFQIVFWLPYPILYNRKKKLFIHFTDKNSSVFLRVFLDCPSKPHFSSIP